MHSKKLEQIIVKCIRFALLVPFLALAAMPAPAGDADWNSPVRLGGSGGLYLLAEPGELWVDIEMADRNVSNRAIHLRAVLFGPDRTVIADEYIPEDGLGQGSGIGPVRRVRLSAEVPRRGVYGVMIAATHDRYGTGFVWGFSTNCENYLVETSRGHKDARHEEPLVFYGPEAEGDICFMPRVGAFDVEIGGLKQVDAPARLFDARDRLVAEATPDTEGKVALGVGAEHPRDAVPWRLRLPVYTGTVQIDGVTRWAPEDGGYEHLSLWTPDPGSWFDFHGNRWLLTPYRQRRNVRPGDVGAVEFTVHNNGREARAVALALAYPDADWAATLSKSEVHLAPGASERVTLAYTAPASGEAARVHVRATAGAFSTYSTVELTPDTGQIDRAVDTPIVLRPFQHENEQFGYAPDYPVTNQVYFDRENRPVVTSRDSVSLLRDGAWRETQTGGLLSSKAAFGGDNGLYLLGRRDGAPALLHSDDGGATFNAYPIPGGGSFDIEQFSGHNSPPGPPPFVRNTLTSRDPDHFWRRLNDLDLFLPTKTDSGAIEIGAPVRLSSLSIGYSGHSGIPSTIMSRGDKVHVVWAEATDPAVEIPGVPTYVATWDRAAGELSEPALVGYGPPANDVHNTPSITMDSQGYLHVLVGTHGRTFLYARSKAPNTAGGGWTEPEPLGPGLRQTYVGFVCDENDTLHVVFRLWNEDTEYFPASLYASLSYMKKAPGEPWTEPRPLIVSAFSEYSVFYHRLTIDRTGDLFLSYDYWSTFWFYRTDRRETRRALITSGDGGAGWKLATGADLE